MFSYSYASWILMGLICWACFAQVWISYRKEGQKMLRHFGSFFAFLALFFMTMGLPVLFPASNFNASQLGAFYIFGHMFLYAAVAYYSRIPMHIHKPEWEMPVFGLNLIWGSVITLVNIAYWNMPTVSSNITQLNVAGPIGPMIGLMVALNFVIGGTALFGKMATTRTGKERYKMVLLAAGLFLIASAGPLHDVANSIRMIIAADVLTFLGVMSLMAGLYIKRIFGDN